VATDVAKIVEVWNSRKSPPRVEPKSNSLEVFSEQNRLGGLHTCWLSASILMVRSVAGKHAVLRELSAKSMSNRHPPVSQASAYAAKKLVVAAYVLATTLLAVVMAWGFSLYQTPTYVATVKMLVSSQTGLVGPNVSWDGGDPQETTLTVSRVVLTESVAQAVVEQLNLSEASLSAQQVLANTSVEPDPGTMFINVSYKDSDPHRAQLIANTIGEVTSRRISEVTLGGNPIIARVWRPATLPQTPVSPKPVSSMLLALVLGLMWGLAIYVGQALALATSIGTPRPSARARAVAAGSSGRGSTVRSGNVCGFA
jgi:capsular polysaccharide biosynthesis protein